MTRGSPYRDPLVQHWTEEELWQALDCALESALGDPDLAADMARHVWMDARAARYPDVELAADALLSALA